jgi:hypothetical protein
MPGLASWIKYDQDQEMKNMSTLFVIERVFVDSWIRGPDKTVKMTWDQ